MKTTFTYDHYYKYAEIKSNLEYFAEKYPALCTLEANCVTKEGRNQYVITITNKETGDALSKPGWYLDGNIHAGEVTASMAAMHTVDYLLTNYGSEETVTKLLDTTTVYVIPRVTPDGAETYLSTPYTLRSVNREYLPEKGGIKDEDLDGDGVVRMMRIPTPYGAWKKDPKDPELMVKRDPGDICGEFFDIYAEGIFEDYDGSENLKEKKPDWGLDFNRNFPYGWFADSRQPGAGAYPLSNVETKAIVDFVLAHPNICGAAIGHTSGGILLYPPGTRAAKTAPAADIAAFKAIAKMGEEELGYKPMNIFDSFMIDQDLYDSGALDDWMYQTQGIPAYTVEFWDINKKAGVPYDWGAHIFEERKTIERFNACVKWVKENCPQYFVSWKPFEHPDLGKVEIGGFNYKFTHQNPPEDLLLTECENDTRFNIRFANAAPRLVIDSAKAEQVSEGIYKLTVTVGNVGYLPTNLTDEAMKLKVDKPVTLTLENAKLIAGKETEELGQLSGYSRTVTGVFFYGNISTDKSAEAKKRVSYIVEGKSGDVIKVKAAHAKAGTACAEIVLP
ncbi:MAG: hypothetical protein IJM76_06240 [Lachnospiraceae bacterium]|nr:hypothetical protein [Lachnospiraceae bacterium]